MSTAVNALVTSVTALLHDAGNTRWTAAHIIEWLGAGQLAVVRRIPAAYPKLAIIDLEAGTLQTAPADAVSMIRVIHNVSATGAALSAPRRVSHELLDTEAPDWHGAAVDKIIRSYTMSPDAPKEFWVSPPQPLSPGQARIQYSAVPPAAVSGGDISIDSIYDNALINYALYRAFDRDSEDGDDVRAERAFKAFEAALK